MTTHFSGRLLAISDLHLNQRGNRDALPSIGVYPGDWLILAGDVGEKLEHLEMALDVLTPRFAKLIWTPGNHDLWSKKSGPSLQRYDDLVAMCRSRGVLTPEDPYPEWPGAPGTFIVPMFLLFDYTFRPEGMAEADAIPWARASGVVSNDEKMIDPAPFSSLPAWCHARCASTEARLNTLPAGCRTVLINHWPLRYDLARPPRIPRFSVWSGTTLTEDWGQRYRAIVVVSGHLHFRTTLFRHGVRYEEVSLGYPRDWRAERGIDWYLREILPGTGPDMQRFVLPIDPFRRTIA